MSLKHVQPIVLLAILALFLSGCDTGRVGLHRVGFAPPAPFGTTASTQQADEEILKQLVRAALAGKGFNEHPGTPHLWQKRGAWVEVYRDKVGVLVLKVRALGSKHDVRVSERTEQELLAILKKQSGLELTPMIPPKPPIN